MVALGAAFPLLPEGYIVTLAGMVIAPESLKTS
jgi:hypothetical protein